MSYPFLFSTDSGFSFLICHLLPCSSSSSILGHRRTKLFSISSTILPQQMLQFHVIACLSVCSDVFSFCAASDTLLVQIFTLSYFIYCLSPHVPFHCAVTCLPIQHSSHTRQATLHPKAAILCPSNPAVFLLGMVHTRQLLLPVYFLEMRVCTTHTLGVSVKFFILIVSSFSQG